MTREEIVSLKEEQAQYGSEIKSTLSDELGARIYCPNISQISGPCRCIPKYLSHNQDPPFDNECLIKARQLLSICAEAYQLNSQKYKHNLAREKRDRTGNGPRKTLEYENFVADNRRMFRLEMGFCEKACQQLLFYSNNFMYKELKNDPENRKSRCVTSHDLKVTHLPKIPNLGSDKHCCRKKCTKFAETDTTAIHKLYDWRERANKSKKSQREVLAEMLRPTKEGMFHCYNFIMTVTG